MQQMYRYILSFTILVSFCVQGFSQQAASEDAGVLYRHEGGVGFILHTTGFGINYRNGKHLTGYKKRMLEIDLVTMKHPKEVRTISQFSDNNKSFVYGKVNSLLVLRGGIGLQNIIYRKEIEGNVEVRYSFYGGATFGFAKPVFLQILHASSDPYKPDIAIEKYDPEKHRLDNIYGKAPFGYGLQYTVVHPGVYAKAAVSFDWEAQEDKLRSLEIGVAADYYPSPIKLMSYNKAKPVFVTIYANILFGRKWN